MFSVLALAVVQGSGVTFTSDASKPLQPHRTLRDLGP